MAIPPNRNKLRRAAVGLAPPLAWWVADPDGCDESSGVVTQQRDLVAGRVITYGSGHRPVRTAGRCPYLTFTGSEGGKDGGGSGGTGLLNGLGEATIFEVWRQSNYTADYSFRIYYGTDTGSGSQAGRMALYTYVSNLRLANYVETPAGTSNESLTNTAAEHTAFHVDVNRWKIADGVTASKVIREDGADISSAYSIAGAVSGTFGDRPFMICTADTSFSLGTAYPGHGDSCDIYVIGSMLSDGVADTLRLIFQSLRGTP